MEEEPCERQALLLSTRQDLIPRPFLIEVLGDAGRHARSAVGMAVLPLDTPVEVEIIVEAGPPVAAV